MKWKREKQKDEKKEGENTERILNQFSPIQKEWRASLVAQWLRIHLPMQGTWVRALVWEDPTCHRATKPVRHNY